MSYCPTFEYRRDLSSLLAVLRMMDTPTIRARAVHVAYGKLCMLRKVLSTLTWVTSTNTVS